MGILAAFIMKKTTFKGEASPFVMELPSYRLPGFKNVFQLLKEKTIDFLKRAFSIILVATWVIWFLQSFDFKFNYVSDSSNSMLAAISGFISPIFKPLGFYDYRITTSLISGILAKESVVSSLMVLFKTEEAIRGTLNIYSAICLLVFCLLYTPCIATIASIKKELGLKYSIIIPIFFLIVAYVASLLFSLVFHIIGVM